MSLHPRRRNVRVRIATVVWLAVVWSLLWGTFAVGTFLVGLLAGALVVALLPMPQIEFEGRVHLVPLLRLIGRFVTELVVASGQVAWLAMAVRRPPRSAVIRVPLRSHSDLYLTLTSAVTSLVPGSIVVEAHRITGTLYVHVLDVGLTGGVEGARRHVLLTEARILRALATDAELAAAGLTRRGPLDAPHEDDGAAGSGTSPAGRTGTAGRTDATGTRGGGSADGTGGPT